MRPSFMGLILSGFLLLIALIIIVLNSRYLKINEIIYITLLFSIGISVHSLLHSNEEIYFNFNPMVGLWNPNDNPSKKIDNLPLSSPYTTTEEFQQCPCLGRMGSGSFRPICRYATANRLT
jgi:hypothetical protein